MLPSRSRSCLHSSVRWTLGPQVKHRDGASVEETREKLCYGLSAIQGLTLFLYGVILFKTVQTVQTVRLKPGS